MRVTRPALATAATQIRCSRAKSETCPGTSKQQLRIRSVLDVPADTSQRPLRPLRQLLPQRAWDGGESVVSETLGEPHHHWRANPGLVRERSAIVLRPALGVIGERRARDSPLCRSQFVQSLVGRPGNRSVRSRRSLLRPEFMASVLAPVPGWTPSCRPSRRP